MAPWISGPEFPLPLGDPCQPTRSLWESPKHQRGVCICRGHFTHSMGLRALAARAASLRSTATCLFLLGPFWQPLPTLGAACLPQRGRIHRGQSSRHPTQLCPEPTRTCPASGFWSLNRRLSRWKGPWRRTWSDFCLREALLGHGLRAVC